MSDQQRDRDQRRRNAKMNDPLARAANRALRRAYHEPLRYREWETGPDGRTRYPHEEALQARD